MKALNKMIRVAPVGLAVLLAGLGQTPVTVAEVIEIPVASQASDMQALPRPQRGVTKTSVRNEFGEPLGSTPAVGDPPISRWEYQDYYVYFEYEHVIHTVLKHRPVNLEQ